MFWYERNKKARYALHIGLNQSVIKASDALYESNKVSS